MSNLQKELKQPRPFENPEHEACVSVLRTAAILADELDGILKPEGIRLPQYNILRILRGSEPKGLYRNELRERMLSRMPDMTRLLDRLENAGLVQRARHQDDRRLVGTRITGAGLKLLERVDHSIRANHVRRFRGLGEVDVAKLIGILDRVRAIGC